MDWGLIIIWLLGIPGAYSVTRPSDGKAMRWFQALLWPIVLNCAVMMLSGIEAGRFFDADGRRD